MRRGDWGVAGELWIRCVHDGTRFKPEVVAGATGEQCCAVEMLFVGAELNVLLGRLMRRDWRRAVENVRLLFWYWGAEMDGETMAKA